MRGGSLPREDARLIELTTSASALPWNIHVVHDGADALRAAQLHATRPPDLLIVDHDIAQDNGVDLVTEMRRNPALCHVPIVVLGTSDNREDILEAYRRGANCYVIKDVYLREKIGALLHFWVETAILPHRS